jgi:hypothetical protein
MKLGRGSFLGSVNISWSANETSRGRPGWAPTQAPTSPGVRVKCIWLFISGLRKRKDMQGMPPTTEPLSRNFLDETFD